MGIEIDDTKCYRCGRLAQSGSQSGMHVASTPLYEAMDKAAEQLGVEGLTSDQRAVLAVFFDDPQPWRVQCNNRAACDRRVRERAADLLPDPDVDNALATGGMLIHYVASDPARAEAFGRWMEHCPGDLPGVIVVDYLAKVHAVLEPGCEIPATTDPTDAGRLLPSDDAHGNA